MHIRLWAVITAVVSGAASPVVNAQNYTPLGLEAKAADGSVKASAKNIDIKRLGLDLFKVETKALAAGPNKAAAFPECNPAPTTADVGGSLNYRRSLISSSAAVKLGIPVATVSTSGNQMVLVQDYSRTKECLATDGETRLLYGQTIRTIITIANIDSQASLTLPAIAASATISGKSNSIQVQVLGFTNPQIPDLIAAISGKELNVETYGEFAKIQSELIKLTTQPATIPTMARLGIVTTEEPDNLKSNVVTAFTLQQIKDGRSCNDAKSRFKEPASPAAAAIDQTYVFVAGACTSITPTSAQKDKAADYLQGLKIRY